ncbi:MAG TPA: hypothetical protein VJ579_02345 [Candidatus Paceibacterota bacterium]|nr:hypothetical protein [Candidatus Paceibacterota bacterium]
MKDSTKKAMKYGLWAALIGALLFFFYRVRKRMQGQQARNDARGARVIDAEVIDMSDCNIGGINQPPPDSKVKEAAHAALDELTSWADAAQRAAQTDWFRKLTSLNFFSKK